MPPPAPRPLVAPPPAAPLGRPGGPRVVLRVDGNAVIGQGHLFRSLILAEALAERHGARCEFLVEAGVIGGLAGRRIVEAGFELTPLERGSDAAGEAAELGALLEDARPDVVILDLLQPDPWDDDLHDAAAYRLPDVPRLLAETRRLGLPCVALSDRTDSIDLAPDLLVAPAPDQLHRLPAASRRALAGPGAYLLPPDILRLRRSAPTPEARRTLEGPIVLFFGGYDHRGFGDLLLPAIRAVAPDHPVTLVVGAGTPPEAAAAARAKADGRLRVIHAPRDLMSILAGAKVVLGAGGNTAFDLSYLGVPSLLAATRRRQAATIGWLAGQGACGDLGEDAATVAARCAAMLPALLADGEARRAMALAGRAAIDGQGTARVADAVAAVALQVLAREVPA